MKSLLGKSTNEIQYSLYRALWSGLPSQPVILQWVPNYYIPRCVSSFVVTFKMN